MFTFILPLVGAAGGALINKKDPLAGAAMGALGGAAPGLLGPAAPAAAAGGAAASGAGGLLAATGGQVGSVATGSALAGGAFGAPIAPITMGSGLLAPGGIGAAGGAAAGGGLMETMKPFMNAATTGMATAQATQQPEEQMQPSPFLMPPQGGPGPQQMQQLVQSIEQDKAQRFPQRVRRY